MYLLILDILLKLTQKQVSGHWLFQSVEHVILGLGVMSLSPILGVEIT